jgi:hypothetical protein
MANRHKSKNGCRTTLHGTDLDEILRISQMQVFVLQLSPALLIALQLVWPQVARAHCGIMICPMQ